MWKYFLVGERLVSAAGGELLAWDWREKRMKPAPELLLAATTGMEYVDGEYEPLDIEELTEAEYLERLEKLT